MIPLQKMIWVSELNTQNPRIESGLKYLSCISRDVSCCFPGFCLFLSFFLLRASPVAHGGSHARSQSYSRQPTPQPEPHQIRDHSSQQCQILNPLSEVRDRTHVPVDASQICSHWATMGTPGFLFLIHLNLGLSTEESMLSFMLTFCTPQKFEYE